MSIYNTQQSFTLFFFFLVLFWHNTTHQKAFISEAKPPFGHITFSYYCFFFKKQKLFLCSHTFWTSDSVIYIADFHNEKHLHVSTKKEQNKNLDVEGLKTKSVNQDRVRHIYLCQQQDAGTCFIS